MKALVSHRNHGKHRPTRYDSVGCDDGAFRVPKEYEAFGEFHDASPLLGLRDECFLLNTNLTNLTNDQRRLNDDENYARLKHLWCGESRHATVNRRTKRE